MSMKEWKKTINAQFCHAADHQGSDHQVPEQHKKQIPFYMPDVIHLTKLKSYAKYYGLL